MIRHGRRFDRVRHRGLGFHATNPQAAVYFNPADTANGSYTLKGTFTNVLEVRVGADKIDYAVNGQVVYSTPKTGSTARTDGIWGHPRQSPARSANRQFGGLETTAANRRSDPRIAARDADSCVLQSGENPILGVHHARGSRSYPS